MNNKIKKPPTLPQNPPDKKPVEKQKNIDTSKTTPFQKSNVLGNYLDKA